MQDEQATPAPPNAQLVNSWPHPVVIVEEPMSPQSVAVVMEQRGEGDDPASEVVEGIATEEGAIIPYIDTGAGVTRRRMEPTDVKTLDDVDLVSCLIVELYDRADRLNAAYKAKKKALAEEIDYVEENFYPVLENVTIKNIPKDRKSINLDYGATVGFRTSQLKLVVDDDEKLLEWCKENLPDAVTTTLTFEDPALLQSVLEFIQLTAGEDPQYDMQESVSKSVVNAHWKNTERVLPMPEGGWKDGVPRTMREIPDGCHEELPTDEFYVQKTPVRKKAGS